MPVTVEAFINNAQCPIRQSACNAPSSAVARNSEIVITPHQAGSDDKELMERNGYALVRPVSETFHPLQARQEPRTCMFKDAYFYIGG